MVKRVVRTMTGAAGGRAAMQVKVEQALIAARYAVTPVRDGEPWTFVAVRRGDSHTVAVRVTTARRLNLESHIEMLKRSASDDINRILIVLDKIPASLKKRNVADNVTLTTLRTFKDSLNTPGSETRADLGSDTPSGVVTEVDETTHPQDERGVDAVNREEQPILPQAILRERVVTVMQHAGFLIHRRLQFEFQLRATRDESAHQREIVIYCGGGSSDAARAAFEARDKAKEYWFVDHYVSPVLRSLVADVPFAHVFAIRQLERPGGLEVALASMRSESDEVAPADPETPGGSDAIPTLQPVTLEATGTVTNPPLERESEKGAGDASSTTIRGSASVAATLDAVIVPPPVPKPRAATVLPIWVDGKLTMVPGPAISLLALDTLMAALHAAKAKLEDVAAEIAASPGNVDRRLIAFLKRVAAAVPSSPPDNYGVFSFGQESETLSRRVTIAAGEGAFSGNQEADLRSIADQLMSCALQFPAWREFKRNAQSFGLTSEQMESAPQIASDLAQKLETPEAREFVDDSVPRALRELATGHGIQSTPDDPTGLIALGADLIAHDAIESAENVLKRLTDAALSVVKIYAGGFRPAAREELKDVGRQHGRGFVRWVFRAGAAGAMGLLGYFVSSFSWLAPYVAYVKATIPGL